MTDSTQKLSEILISIQNVAFETHEFIESQGRVPLTQLESLIFNRREVPIEIRTHILWPYLIFTRARLSSQNDFQNTLNLKLNSAESSFIVRQLICTPPKVWSYRKSYQRGFAHTVSGPNKHNELSIDACLSVTGHIYTNDHLYLFGWTLSYHDKMYLICADTLIQNQTYQIEQIRPFPLQLDDDNYWEENQISFLNELYASENASSHTGTAIEQSEIIYAPEQRYNTIHRILISSCSSQIAQVQTLQETVATQSADVILETVTNIVKRQSIKSSYYTNEELIHRLLQSVGCDDDGNMPCAHASLIAMDPVCLLLLPEDNPVIKELNPRDSIKMALNHPNCTDEIREAFDIYQREKRWIAAFSCFDLSIESHAVHFGIPVNSLERIFTKSLFSSRLPVIPQGDVLKQLQNKYGLYQPNDDPPTFRSVLDILNSRSFIKSGNMSNIAKWLMNCCERYRYCLTHIEPDISNSQRSIDQNNQKLLQKGLRNLADMFRK